MNKSPTKTTGRSTAQKRPVKRQATFVQFSKKLIAAVMIFWGIIRLFSVVAVFLNPDAATHMAAIVAGIDEIAMVNSLAYTSNSISEKLGLGYFNYKSEQAKLLSEAEQESDENNG